MKTKSFRTFLLALMLITGAGCGFIDPVNLFAQTDPPIVVKVSQPMAAVQSTMWGIFFEDINLAADGGVYAELVKNRSFEFFQPLMGWKILKPDTTSGITILNQGGTNPSNPRFARVTLGEHDKSFGLSNAGFRGMGVKQGVQYHFSVIARQTPGSSIGLRAELLSSDGRVIGNASISPDVNDWKKYTVDFTTSTTDPRAKLAIWFDGKGSLDLDMISLFPEDTWKNRAGGLRADLVQLLADLKPGFIRFPGGCIVEGRELETRYQWKKTIGKPEERQMIVNRWNTEFKHRPTPDYFQTFGLGFYEYFQLAEDIGAEPLPIMNCGMACQFNTGELVPLEQLDPYIQDALDLIEFANGSTDSRWGKIRAQMGHAAPFNLKMIGIGNEQWGPQYIERYVLFSKVIKEKYPEIMMVSSAGPSPNGKFFEYASGELKKLKAEIVDEHYYARPEWFLQNAARYDNYDRNSYKIFAGEYAAQSKYTVSSENQNNWNCALAEAAFMTGLERNADVVYLCSYAPLFAHVEGWQWTPDLIWFDNLESYGTPSYYVQKLFSNNKGTHVLPMLLDNKPLTGQDELYASAALDQQTNDIILKLVNVSSQAQQINVMLEGVRKLAPKGRMIMLKGVDLDAVNSLKQPLLVSPVVEELNLKGRSVLHSLPPYSFTVIRIKSLK
jgi:alpha-N-arabinofuranosidase